MCMMRSGNEHRSADVRRDELLRQVLKNLVAIHEGFRIFQGNCERGWFRFLRHRVLSLRLKNGPYTYYSEWVLNLFAVRPRLDYLAGVAHDYLCGCAGCVQLKTTVTTCCPCKLSTHHAEQSTCIPLVGFPCVKSLADVNGAVIQALVPESSVNLAAKTVVCLV